MSKDNPRYTLLIVPDSVKSTPGSDLFKQTTKDIRVPALTQDIRLQIGNLLGQVSVGKKGIDDVNSIAFKTSGRGINAFESDESKQNLGDIIAAYGDDSNKRQDPFAKRIAETLSAIGSKISAVNVVDRIRTQTCAGCHQFSDSRDDKSFPNRPPDLRKGFDTVGLGGKAKWPNKACGDIDMKVCKSPKDNPTHPTQLLATIYHALGIDPGTIVYNHLNQPRELVKADAVTELFG